MIINLTKEKLKKSEASSISDYIEKYPVKWHTFLWLDFCENWSIDLKYKKDLT